MALKNKVQELEEKRLKKEENFKTAVEVLVKYNLLIPANLESGNGELEEKYIFKTDAQSLKEFDSGDRKIIRSAIKVLCNYDITELVPVDFEMRDFASQIIDEVKSIFAESGPITSGYQEEILSTINDKNVQVKNLVSDLIGSINTLAFLVNDPAKVISAYSSQRNLEKNIIIESENGSYPLSKDYISAWLVSNKIVGETFNQSKVMFDEVTLNNEKGHGEILHSMLNTLGDFSELVVDFSDDNLIYDFLKNASPDYIVEAVKDNPCFKEMFDAEAMVWERFTVGEHTETTMRVFDETFEGSVPDMLVPFVKMALVCHDAGKGVNKDKNAMSPKNVECSKEILNYFGVKQSVQEMILFATGEAQHYTSRYYIHRDLSAENLLTKRCAEVLEKALERTATEAEVKGFASICKIIQNCDSGAYTRYGVTRDEKRGIYHTNGNDRFTASFHKPIDLRGRAQYLIDPKEFE